MIAVFFGLASLGGTHPATERAWVLLFDVMKWPLDGAQGRFDSNARVLSAVCGGLIVSWSVMLLWLLNVPFLLGLVLPLHWLNRVRSPRSLQSKL